MVFAAAVAAAISLLIAGAWERPIHAQTPDVPPSSVRSHPANAGQAPAPRGPSTWSAGAVYPTTIVRYAFVQVGDDAYVISGVANGSVQTAVRRYNAGANSWTTLAPIPIGSEAPAAAYYNGKIYVAGGASVTALQIYDVASNTWGSGAAKSTDSYGAAAGAFGGKVYVVGGGIAGASTAVAIYDIAGNAWATGTAAPA